MKVDVCLRDAIAALDLSSWDTRYGATALAILLIENILRAESEVPGNMDIYFNRLECGWDEINEIEDNIRPLSYAASMLYGAYGLMHYRYRGIRSYLDSTDAATSRGI